jgi:hypothetical protein
VVRHCPRHEVARVVVHEADEVHALVTAKLEREDVALPQLVRFGAFEPTRRFVTRLAGVLFGDEPCLVQDAPYRRLRHTEALETSEHVADATCSPLRVCFARCDDPGAHRIRVQLFDALHRGGLPGRRRRQTLERPQGVHPTGLKQRHELSDHRR